MQRWGEADANGRFMYALTRNRRLTHSGSQPEQARLRQFHRLSFEYRAMRPRKSGGTGRHHFSERRARRDSRSERHHEGHEEDRSRENWMELAGDARGEYELFADKIRRSSDARHVRSSSNSSRSIYEKRLMKNDFESGSEELRQDPLRMDRSATTGSRCRNNCDGGAAHAAAPALLGADRQIGATARRRRPAAPPP